jgi:hypothetical protein
MATNNDVNAAYTEAATRMAHARELQKKANKAMRQADQALAELGKLVARPNPFLLKEDWQELARPAASGQRLYDNVAHTFTMFGTIGDDPSCLCGQKYGYWAHQKGTRGLVAVADVDPATTVATEIPANIVYECPYCPHARHMGHVCSGCPCDARQYAIESAAPSELTAAILAHPLGRLARVETIDTRDGAALSAPVQAGELIRESVAGFHGRLA